MDKNSYLRNIETTETDCICTSNDVKLNKKMPKNLNRNENYSKVNLFAGFFLATKQLNRICEWEWEKFHTWALKVKPHSCRNRNKIKWHYGNYRLFSMVRTAKCILHLGYTPEGRSKSSLDYWNIFDCPLPSVISSAT
jgi:hypothetical protein